MDSHPLAHQKISFLNWNREFLEVIPSGDSKTIGHLQSIDEKDDEIWFLQCPKGTDIIDLLEQKIKLPGRTNIGEMEAVAVESISPEDYAFGYCNKKGKYNLRVLPVRGNIVMRKALKMVEKVSTNEMKERCPKPTRVPFPDQIKERHPFFGVDFQKHLKVDKKISKKLQEAERNSIKISAEERSNKYRIASEQQSNMSSKKSKKRSVKEEKLDSSDSNINSKKIKNESLLCDDEISPDLKWLQDL